jgi:folylpolyglutamate synthase/dihydropteroate synthase
MLRALRPVSDLVIATRAASPRAASPRELAWRAGGPAVWTESVEAAVTLARTAASADDAIVVAGSFYVAGEALRVLSESI